jgi:predicted N-acetyltransferase YhbS
MDDVYLDVDDGSAFDALLPSHHNRWGAEIAIEEYRACLLERAEHGWARRHVRNLVLRSAEGGYLSSLRLHAVRGLQQDRKIRLGGIGEVLTPEDLRGKGYASRLVGMTLELLEREGVDGAYLFSDIDPRFYARFGFVVMSSGHVDLPLHRIPDARPEGCEIRPRQAADWEGIRRIHHMAGAGEPFWLARDDDQWGYLLGRWPLWARHDADYRLAELDCVALRGGRIVGYALAIGELAERTMRLLEFGMERTDSEVLFELLAHLRRRGTDLGCAQFVAPHPPGVSGAAFREVFPSVPRREGIFMLASLSPRLDLSCLTGRDAGYWETDHV